MIASKWKKRIGAVVVGLTVSSSAAAFSYGILAAGILVGCIAVVAAPYVAVALTAAEITGVMSTVAIHSALAAYVFGQPVKPAATMPPVMVTMVNQAAVSAKPVKVNLSPMTAAAKTAYTTAKTVAVTAAATTPKAGAPASGQASAQSTATSNIQPGIAVLQSLNPSGHVVFNCTDNAPGAYTVRCSVGCNDCYNLTDAYYTSVHDSTVPYTAPVSAVNCPTGSHQVGSICTVNKDATADTVVNDGTSTPQWNPLGVPDDAVMSNDKSTISRTQVNSDGTTTTSNATLQPDGSMAIVDSTYNPATDQTAHAGYAVDTNGVIQKFAGAVSAGNLTTPNPATTFPNGSTPNGSGSSSGGGGDGGCGSVDKPNCTIDFGTPDAGPALPAVDSTDYDTAFKGSSILDGLSKFQMPAHTSACPVMAVSTEYFRKSGTVSTNGACDLIENNRATLSAIFSLIWVLAALLIVLSA
jgi:hypothetical protein